MTWASTSGRASTSGSASRSTSPISSRSLPADPTAYPYLYPPPTLPFAARPVAPAGADRHGRLGGVARSRRPGRDAAAGARLALEHRPPRLAAVRPGALRRQRRVFRVPPVRRWTMARRQPAPRRVAQAAERDRRPVARRASAAGGRSASRTRDPGRPGRGDPAADGPRPVARLARRSGLVQPVAAARAADLLRTGPRRVSARAFLSSGRRSPLSSQPCSSAAGQGSPGWASRRRRVPIPLRAWVHDRPAGAPRAPGARVLDRDRHHVGLGRAEPGSRPWPIVAGGWFLPILRRSADAEQLPEDQLHPLAEAAEPWPAAGAEPDQ